MTREWFEKRIKNMMDNSKVLKNSAATSEYWKAALDRKYKVTDEN